MTSIEFVHHTILAHLAAGAWEEASDAAEFALRQDPDHGGLHEARGIAEYHRERYGLAMFHLESAAALIPLGPEAQLLLADIYLRIAQTQAAQAILTFLAEDGRCPIPLLPDLAKALGWVGLYADALTVCQKLTEHRPNYHPAWFGVAFYLGRMGRPSAELLAPLRQATALAPLALPYRLNLAAVHADLGHNREAYDLFQTVPIELVNCIGKCRQFARVCSQIGDERRAASYLARAETIAKSTDSQYESDSDMEI